MRSLFTLYFLFLLGSITLMAQEPLPLREKKIAPKETKDEKKDEKKEDQKKPLKDEEKKPTSLDDIQKAAERIIHNAKEAGKRLGEKDPGIETRKLQQDILKDIDALMRKSQEPPPPDSSDQPPPMNSSSSSPMGGTSQGSSSQQNRSQSRRERRQRSQGKMEQGNDSIAQKQPQPMANGSGNQPMETQAKKDAGNGGTPKSMDPKKQVGKLSDLYKDVWGHLPERLRQDMDQYYREQFMPRYADLLREYYSSLAEQRRKKENGD